MLHKYELTWTQHTTMCKITYTVCPCCRLGKCTLASCDKFDGGAYDTIRDKIWTWLHSNDGSLGVRNLMFIKMCEGCHDVLVEVVGHVDDDDLEHLFHHDINEIRYSIYTMNGCVVTRIYQSDYEGRIPIWRA